MTMRTAQADLSIWVSTPMSTYRSNSFSTASCIVNANGKGIRNTGTPPSFSSTCVRFWPLATLAFSYLCHLLPSPSSPLLGSPRAPLPMLFQHSGVTMVTAAPVSSSIRVDLPLILTVTSKLCARSLTA
ncbi:hypothetical protein T03_14439 [Trichinella britovi]|uniref:Uncharacterized protein n=1 Tax=Trichinella britovi TaxID=45882 RepID=A0A0V1D0Y6_TRIBR|nr:hypothetical protein T03_14439 [Trichinella britovi]